MRSVRWFRGLATATATITMIALLFVAPAAATTSCCGFKVVSSPNASSLHNSLNAQLALFDVDSAADGAAWAVGYSYRSPDTSRRNGH